jgi:ferredoxin--NADP+ reductase
VDASELRVAVVGAGPAGLYVADALIFQKDVPVRVDVFDRLPTPFGLLRYGVAPDHLKMKSLSRALQRTLDDERVRFFGNVTIGTDVTVEELRTGYHAVVYTFGAAADRRLDIAGEDLVGSTSATDFVTWYSGHPDVPTDRFDLTGVQTAVVVGVGNVAVDVARVLTKPVDDLRSTDIPSEVLERLAQSGVTDVHVLGRRGPVHAKWTSKELRELGELTDVDVVVDPAQLVLTDDEQAVLAAEPALARNHQILQEWAERPLTGAGRRLHLRFWSRPVEVLGSSGAVSHVRIEATCLDEQGRCVGTGASHDLPAQLLLRSVGYRGTPVPGIPFDEDSCTVPHDGGRVLRDGAVASGEYVAGWIGRGPIGVLGTNRSDAEGVVTQLLADVPTLLATQPTGPLPVDLLEARGVHLVDSAGWSAIDQAEVALGKQDARPRAKLATWSGLLDAAGAGPR